MLGIMSVIGIINYNIHRPQKLTSRMFLCFH
jgi:hypothetical protein